MSANITSRWEGGHLIFQVVGGDDILDMDDTGKIVIPAAGGLEVKVGATVTGIVAAEAATETTPGSVELATNAEVQTGTDTERAITPSGLTARTATTTRTGIAELATDAEAITGTDAARIVTPANLAAAVTTHVAAATASVAGKVELATDAEAITGTDATRATTPANLAAAVATHVPAATDAVAGKAELATTAEAKTGSDTGRIITPATLTAVLVNCKVMSFAGKNGAGACTAVGAAVGDRVIGVAGLTDMGAADASFESTVTIVDQIQQSSASDLSTKNFLALLLPVS